MLREARAASVDSLIPPRGSDGQFVPSRYGDRVSLDDARAALARHDWLAAYESAGHDAVAGDARVDAAWLDVRADAAWWLGRMDDCIASREAAYAIYEATGDERRAGQCAVWLYEHYVFRAQPTIAGAWLRRGRQRLDDERVCVEYGNLVVREVEVMHGRGELEEAIVHANGALELALQLHSTDLQAEAQQALGRVLIDQRQRARRPRAARRSDVARGRGTLEPLLDGQGVLQPHQRVRAGRRLPTCG